MQPYYKTKKARTVFGTGFAARCALHAVVGAADQLELEILVERGEVGIIAGDAHHQVAVGVGICHCRAHGVAGDDVELHLHSAERNIGAGVGGQMLDGLLVTVVRRGIDLDVEGYVVVHIQRVEAADVLYVVQQTRRGVGLRSQTGREGKTREAAGGKRTGKRAEGNVV